MSKASLAQLYSMITDCISQCGDATAFRLAEEVVPPSIRTFKPPSIRTKKVTQAMASIARDRYFRFDLNLHSSGFMERLAVLCVNAIQDMKWEQAAEDNAWIPSVVVHQVSDPAIQPFEVAVVHDFAPTSFVSEVRKQMNDLTFLRGAGGKTQAFLRCASVTEHPAPFTTNKIVYSGVAAADIERKLLAIANTICAGQEAYVKAKLRNAGYLVTFAANQLLTVVATFNEALFKQHSDFSERLCSPDAMSRYEVTEGLHLPLRSELQVITFVLSNSPCSKHSSDLVYYKESHQGAGSGTDQIKKIPLSNCCLHMQGAGSQNQGIKHAAVAVTGATIGKGTDNLDTIWRLSITCRCTLDPVLKRDIFATQLESELGYAKPSEDWKSDYNECHVFDQMASDSVMDAAARCSPEKVRDTGINSNTPITRQAAPGHQMQGLRGNAGVNIMSKDNSDTFPRIGKEDFDNLCTFQCTQRIEFVGQMSNLLSTYTMTRFLFDAGFLVQIQDDHAQPIPILHHVNTVREVENERRAVRSFPMMGEYYLLSHITAKAGLKHSSRSARAFDPTQTHPEIVILSKLYKNGRESVLAFKGALDEWVQDRSKPFLTADFSGPLVMGGSGGSPKKLGDTATDFAKQSKEDAVVQIPFSQDFESSFNVGLRRLSERAKVVAVYVREDEMFQDGNKFADVKETEHSVCRFWGHFACVNSTTGAEKQGDVAMEMIKFGVPIPDQHLYRYRIVPHLKLFLEPLFTNEQLWATMSKDYREFTMLTVQRKYPTDSKMMVDFEMGHQGWITSFGTASITHGDLGRLILEKGMEKVYISKQDSVIHQSNDVLNVVGDDERIGFNDAIVEEGDSDNLLWTRKGIPMIDSTVSMNRSGLMTPRLRMICFWTRKKILMINSRMKPNFQTYILR